MTAAELLSVAAFLEGKHAQAFPSFGAERMGAPVMAFCRIADREIRLREPVERPDAVVVQDPTLLHQIDVFQGLGATGYVLINTSRSLADLRLEKEVAGLASAHVAAVPATDLALEHVGRPLPNAALLGGFAAMTGRLEIGSIEQAIRNRFRGRIGEANAAAARAAHDLLWAQMHGKELHLAEAG